MAVEPHLLIDRLVLVDPRLFDLNDTRNSHTGRSLSSRWRVVTCVQAYSGTPSRTHVVTRRLDEDDDGRGASTAASGSATARLAASGRVRSNPAVPADAAAAATPEELRHIRFTSVIATGAPVRMASTAPATPTNTHKGYESSRRATNR
jgi:hypothetical protein